MPRSCRARTTSAALYAAIPPLTPSAIFISLTVDLIIDFLIARCKPQPRRETLNPPSAINKSASSFSPARVPYPERLRPARQRCGCRESPTSLCRRGFHPARCGRACGSWCRPRAGRQTAVALHAAPPPECSGSCYQNLRSTSLRLSLKQLILQSYEMPSVKRQWLIDGLESAVVEPRTLTADPSTLIRAFRRTVRFSGLSRYLK